MEIPSDRSPLVRTKTQFYLDRQKVLSEICLVPNIISLIRILLIFPIAILYAKPSQTAFYWAFGLLCLSYLSDYADGEAARRLNMKSALGLIMDPLADKIWTVSMLYLLVTYRALPMWVGVIIVLRDVAILILTGRVLRITGVILPSEMFGKSYMVTLGLMVIGMTLRIENVIWIAYLLVPFAVFTLANYYRRALKIKKEFTAPLTPESASVQ